MQNLRDSFDREKQKELEEMELNLGRWKLEEPTIRVSCTSCWFNPCRCKKYDGPYDCGTGV